MTTQIDDLSRSLVALEQDTTLIAAVEQIAEGDQHLDQVEAKAGAVAGRVHMGGQHCREPLAIE